MKEIAEILRTIAGVAQVAAAMLPGPSAVVVRVLGAAAGAASVGFDAGLTEAQVVERIHRMRAIDTSGVDAEIDAAIDAKPERGDEEPRP